MYMISFIYIIINSILLLVLLLLLSLNNDKKYKSEIIINLKIIRYCLKLTKQRI